MPLRKMYRLQQSYRSPHGEGILLARFAAISVDAAARAGAMCGPMNPAAFHDRLAVLGLSVRRFAAMTGVQYATARHWGVAGREFPRWVPLMLEMMDPTVAMKPPDESRTVANAAGCARVASGFWRPGFSITVIDIRDILLFR
jgi:hypothetical protein